MSNSLLEASFSSRSVLFTKADIDRTIPYFQPIVDSNTGSVVTLEALARIKLGTTVWEPKDFLSYISEDLSPYFDLHMLKQSCLFIKQNIKNGMGIEEIPRINVNFSPKTLSDENMAQQIIDCVQKHNVSMHKIGVEVLEQSFGSYQNEARVLNTLIDLNVAGVGIAFDDVGAGESNINRAQKTYRHLNGEGACTLKLDRKLVGIMLGLTGSFDSVRRNNPAQKFDIVYEGISPKGMFVVRQEANRSLKLGGSEAFRTTHAFQTYALSRPMPSVSASELIQQPRQYEHVFK